MRTAALSRRRDAAGRTRWMVVALGVFAMAGCSTSAPMSAHHGSVGPAAPHTAAGRASTVSARSAGAVNRAVPSMVRKTKGPVSLDGIADFGDGVSATIRSLTAVETQARGPGEVSGPGVEVTIGLVNRRTNPITLDSVAVNVFDAVGTPGSPMSQSPAPPFSGTLAPHKAMTGTYVFNLPTARRSPITVELSYTSTAPVVRFVGNR